MTRAELAEAARATGEMIEALVARLAEVGATLTSVSDEISQMQTKHAELTTALENYEKQHWLDVLQATHGPDQAGANRAQGPDEQRSRAA
jgi:phosphoglycerate-specific signal transduction histidine kinase